MIAALVLIGVLAGGPPAEPLIVHAERAEAAIMEAAAYRIALEQEAVIVQRWTALHDCEQPGNWYAAGSTSVGYFEGGLGILASLYRSIAGHSALQDSPRAQMAVAEVVLARFGRSAWACRVP